MSEPEDAQKKEAYIGSELIPIINRLQDIFAVTGGQIGSKAAHASSLTLELPQIVVVGSQSSGCAYRAGARSLEHTLIFAAYALVVHHSQQVVGARSDCRPRLSAARLGHCDAPAARAAAHPDSGVGAGGRRRRGAALGC